MKERQKGENISHWGKKEERSHQGNQLDQVTERKQEKKVLKSTEQISTHLFKVCISHITIC